MNEKPISCEKREKLFKLIGSVARDKTKLKVVNFMNESGKISTVVITYSSGNSKTNNSKSLEVICENKAGNN